MATEQEQTHEQAAARALEVGIRLVPVAGMVFWSLQILFPFLPTVIWALFIFGYLPLALTATLSNPTLRGYST
jgi:hypothetical protein